MSHVPKTLALEAYLDDALSDAGRARLERHLQRCQVCQSELRRMRRYRGTLEVIRAAPLPAIDWTRIEGAVEQPQTTSQAAPGRPAPDPRRLWVWPLVAVAAAAVILLFSPGRVPPPAPSQPVALPQPGPERAPVSGTITFAANAVSIEDTEGVRKVQGDEPVTEKSVLRTGRDGIVHVRLWSGTGLALAPNSELFLSRLRQGQVRLQLRRGHVYSRVARLGQDDHYVVTAESYTAHVRGTAFGVSRAGSLARVRVDEGRVEVRRAEAVVDVLSAGDEWSSEPAREVLIDDFVGSQDRRLRGLHGEGAEHWPWLTLPVTPQVSAWLPWNAEFPAQGGLRMRHPPGPGSLQLLDAQGQLRVVEFELGTQGLTLGERDVLDREERPQEPRWGTLAIEKIRPVVRRGLPDLRRCYEHTLRQDDSARGSITLHIRVSPTGRVTQARVQAPELPRSLRRCVKQRVTSWAFPAPDGGQVQLELPVNLRHAR